MWLICFNFGKNSKDDILFNANLFFIWGFLFMKQFFKNSFIFCILFIHASGLVAGNSSVAYVIPRIHMPTHKNMDEITKESTIRSIKKYAITAGVAVAAGLVIWTAYHLREYATQQEDDRLRQLAAAAVDKKMAFYEHKDPLKQLDASAFGVKNPVKKEGFLQAIKDMGKSSARFVGDTTFTLGSALTLNFIYQSMQNKIIQAYQDETLLWYIQEHTQIPHILNDLKEYSIAYDVYATLLSKEALNDESGICMKAFVKDMVEVTNEKLNASAAPDNKFLGFMLDEMKKKYRKKCTELEKLQAFVVPHVGMRERILKNDKNQDSFIDDAARRKHVARLCQLFADEMNKVVAFAVLQFGNKYDMASTLVRSCNVFIDRMELLLNSSSVQLLEASKADRGMFTNLYEFEHAFWLQMNQMQRYSSLSLSE